MKNMMTHFYLKQSLRVTFKSSFKVIIHTYAQSRKT